MRIRDRPCGNDGYLRGDDRTFWVAFACASFVVRKGAVEILRLSTAIGYSCIKIHVVSC